MPRMRRRPLPMAASPIGSLRLMRLHIGSWWQTPEAIATARAEYRSHRAELLERFPVDENGPAAFWAFEPCIPAALRRDYAGRAAWLRTRR